MRLHRNSNGMIYDGINLVQWTICRYLLCLSKLERGIRVGKKFA